MRIEDDFYAIGDVCSHEDYSLSEGEVVPEACEIECWKHGSMFDLVTGEPRSLPATRPVPVYVVRVEGGRRARGAPVTTTAPRPTQGSERVHELAVSGLRAGVAGLEVLTGVDVVVRSGEVHAVMGPNGSGKSTLAHVLMGKPGYQVLGGSVTLDGRDLLSLAPFERARLGLFLAPQDPVGGARGGVAPRHDRGSGGRGAGRRRRQRAR